LQRQRHPRRKARRVRVDFDDQRATRRRCFRKACGRVDERRGAHRQETSQSSAAAAASIIGVRGIASPNHTTSDAAGRHSRHSGAARRGRRRRAPRPPARPCSGRAGCCRDIRGPTGCRRAGAGPSTFWVTSVRRGTRCARATSARDRHWARRGGPAHGAIRTISRRARDRARRLPAVAVLRDGTSTREPVSASRKVGMPLSAEIPAPVRTKTCRALLIAAAARSISPASGQGSRRSPCPGPVHPPPGLNAAFDVPASWRSTYCRIAAVLVVLALLRGVDAARVPRT